MAATAEQTFYIKRGDTLYDLQYSLTGPAGMDLTGATVKFKMMTAARVPVLDAPAVILQAVNPPIVAYVWQVGDTDTAANFQAEFEVTFAVPVGGIKTFPDPGFIQVVISADIS